MDEFELFVGIAKKIWFRRNLVVHGGEFLHPNICYKKLLRLMMNLEGQT
jgi:hypothetical protein